MKKNVAGQTVGAQLISKTDGSAVTTGTTDVYITGDGGTQYLSGVSPSGAVHEGNGYWSYPASQADTNFDHVAFTFVNSSAVNATIQIYTSYPQTGDNYARLGAPAGASLSADVAQIYARVGAASGSPTGQSISDDLLDIKLKVDTNLDAAVSTRLAPTVAGRTLDVTTTGEAGIDWANIGAPTTTVNLSGTSVKTATDVETDTQDIQSRLPAALVSGRMDSSVGAMANNVLTAAAIATDAIDADALASDAVTEIQSGLSTLNAAGVRSAVGLASANLDTQLASLATASSLTTVGNNVNTIKTTTDLLQSMLEVGSGSPTYYRFTVGALELAPTGGTAPSAAVIADAVWDEVLSGHAGVGSAGAALTAAGSAGDPWATPLPGAYSSGTAGNIIGNNLDATISSRTKPADTQAAVTTVTNLTNAPTNGDLTATMKASITTAASSSTPALSTAGNAAVADKILGRNLAGGSDGGRMVKDALRSLRNKTSISAGTLTVCEEDDSTPAWTAAVTTTPGDPLSAIDPA